MERGSLKYDYEVTMLVIALLRLVVLSYTFQTLYISCFDLVGQYKFTKCLATLTERYHEYVTKTLNT